MVETWDDDDFGVSHLDLGKLRHENEDGDREPMELVGIVCDPNERAEEWEEDFDFGDKGGNEALNAPFRLSFQGQPRVDTPIAQASREDPRVLANPSYQHIASLETSGGSVGCLSTWEPIDDLIGDVRVVQDDLSVLEWELALAKGEGNCSKLTEVHISIAVAQLRARGASAAREQLEKALDDLRDFQGASDSEYEIECRLRLAGILLQEDKLTLARDQLEGVARTKAYSSRARLFQARGWIKLSVLLEGDSKAEDATLMIAENMRSELDDDASLFHDQQRAELFLLRLFKLARSLHQLRLFGQSLDILRTIQDLARDQLSLSAKDDLEAFIGQVSDSIRRGEDNEDSEEEEEDWDLEIAREEAARGISSAAAISTASRLILGAAKRDYSEGSQTGGAEHASASRRESVVIPRKHIVLHKEPRKDPVVVVKYPKATPLLTMRTRENHKYMTNTFLKAWLESLGKGLPSDPKEALHSQSSSLSSSIISQRDSSEWMPNVLRHCHSLYRRSQYEQCWRSLVEFFDKISIRYAGTEVQDFDIDEQRDRQEDFVHCYQFLQLAGLLYRSSWDRQFENMKKATKRIWPRRYDAAIELFGIETKAHHILQDKRGGTRANVAALKSCMIQFMKIAECLEYNDQTETVSSQSSNERNQLEDTAAVLSSAHLIGFLAVVDMELLLHGRSPLNALPLSACSVFTQRFGGDATRRSMDRMKGFRSPNQTSNEHIDSYVASIFRLSSEDVDPLRQVLGAEGSLQWRSDETFVEKVGLESERWMQRSIRSSLLFREYPKCPKWSFLTAKASLALALSALSGDYFINENGQVLPENGAAGESTTMSGPIVAESALIECLYILDHLDLLGKGGINARLSKCELLSQDAYARAKNRQSAKVGTDLPKDLLSQGRQGSAKRRLTGQQVDASGASLVEDWDTAGSLTPMGLVALSAYAEVLLVNKKYMYSIVSFASAATCFKATGRHEHEHIYRRLAAIAAEAGDYSLAKDYYEVVLKQLVQDRRAHERVFVSELISSLELKTGNVWKAIARLETAANELAGSEGIHETSASQGSPVPGLESVRSKERVDAHLLSIELKLARTLLRTNRLWMGVRLMESLTERPIPHGKRNQVMVALTESYLKVRWLEEARDMIKRIQDENISVEERARENTSSHRDSYLLRPIETITTSCYERLTAKLFLCFGHYKRALQSLDRAIGGERKGSRRAGLYLLKGKTYSMWCEEHSPTIDSETFSNLSSSSSTTTEAKARKVPGMDEGEISRNDLVNNGCAAFLRAWKMFSRVDDGWHAFKCVYSASRLLVDYVFSQVAFCGERSGDVLVSVSRAIADLAALLGMQIPNDQEDSFAALRVMEAAAIHVMDISAECCDPLLVLNRFRDVFVSGARVTCARQFPPSFLESLLSIVRKIVLFQTLLDSDTINENMDMIDVLLSLEEDYRVVTSRSKTPALGYEVPVLQADRSTIIRSMTLGRAKKPRSSLRGKNTDSQAFRTYPPRLRAPVKQRGALAGVYASDDQGARLPAQLSDTNPEIPLPQKSEGFEEGTAEKMWAILSHIKSSRQRFFDRTTGRDELSKDNQRKLSRIVHLNSTRREHGNQTKDSGSNRTSLTADDISSYSIGSNDKSVHANVMFCLVVSRYLLCYAPISGERTVMVIGRSARGKTSRRPAPQGSSPSLRGIGAVGGDLLSFLYQRIAGVPPHATKGSQAGLADATQMAMELQQGLFEGPIQILHSMAEAPSSKLLRPVFDHHLANTMNPKGRKRQSSMANPTLPALRGPLILICSRVLQPFPWETMRADILVYRYLSFSQFMHAAGRNRGPVEELCFLACTSSQPEVADVVRRIRLAKEIYSRFEGTMEDGLGKTHASLSTLFPSPLVRSGKKALHYRRKYKHIHLIDAVEIAVSPLEIATAFSNTVSSRQHPIFLVSYADLVATTESMLSLFSFRPDCTLIAVPDATYKAAFKHCIHSYESLKKKKTTGLTPHFLVMYLASGLRTSMELPVSIINAPFPIHKREKRASRDAIGSDASFGEVSSEAGLPEGAAGTSP